MRKINLYVAISRVAPIVLLVIVLYSLCLMFDTKEDETINQQQIEKTICEKVEKMSLKELLLIQHYLIAGECVFPGRTKVYLTENRCYIVETGIKEVLRQLTINHLYNGKSWFLNQQYVFDCRKDNECDGRLIIMENELTFCIQKNSIGRIEKCN